MVNAASYAQPVAAGSIIAIFGTNLANGVYQATTTPLPTNLGGTSVSINGISAPLFYASPAQINAQVPSSLSPIYSLYGGLNGVTTASVVVTTASGTSAASPFSIYADGPGVFTLDGSGCGQALAFNVAADGSLSLNGPTSSAAPGDYVALFGTGFGTLSSPPLDGTPASAAEAMTYGGLTWGDVSLGELQNYSAGSDALTSYYGIAPEMVGVDQVNFQLPADTRNGCAVPVTLGGEVNLAPTVSIAVSSSGGQCADPPTQSYGTITLARTITTTSGQSTEADTFTASFPEGPALMRPASDVPTSGAIAAREVLFEGLPSRAPPRSCPVAGYAELSLGAITVSGPGGSATVQSSSSGGSVLYSLDLPQGFLGTGGKYSVSDMGSSAGSASSTVVSVDSPIEVTSVTISPYGSPGGLEVNWTGGSSNSAVKVSLVADGSYTGGYAAATAGSFGLATFCSGNPVSAGGSGVFCDFPPIVYPSQIVVEQMPFADLVPTFQVSGITSGVQVLWDYRYVFTLPVTLP